MAFSKKQRLFIHQIFEGHCGYCGKVISLKEMQIDHIHPLSIPILSTTIGLFGEEKTLTDHNDKSNLMPTCRRCNHYKRAGTLKEFRHSMITLHERLTNIYIVKVGLDFGIINIKPFSGIFYFERQNKSLTI